MIVYIMYNEVVFDVETKRFFDPVSAPKPEDLGLSIVSVYSRILDENFKETQGTMQSFWEDQLGNLWSLFERADRIIGFNSVRFDIPVLRPYTDIPIHKYPHFDILEEVKKAFGKRIKLDSIAQSTLGTRKTDVGTRAVEYFEKGDKQSLQKLQKYCEADVLITRDIYDHALKHGELKFKDHWNTPRTIKVDFSYTKQEAAKDSQMGLF